MKNITGKVAAITGGASGIGFLLALDLAKRGAKVALIDINKEGLEHAVAQAQEQGLNLYPYVGDVSVFVKISVIAARIASDLGPIDIVVNSAGVVSGKSFLDLEPANIEKTMNINVLGVFWLIKSVLPSMITRNTGHIITISSAGGLVGVPGLSDYSASKFAVFGLDEALRMELKKTKAKVKTTVVCPFYISTGMFEGVKTKVPFLLPILKPEKIVKKISALVWTNKKRLLTPPLVYSIALLRLLPVSWFDFFARLLGVTDSMDEFRGRIKN